MSQIPKWVGGAQQFITVKDAANFMGCSIDLIYDAIAEKTLPAKEMIKKRKRPTWRIPKNQFLKWAGYTE